MDEQQIISDSLPLAGMAKARDRMKSAPAGDCVLPGLIDAMIKDAPKGD
jgi:hypothetical protein